MGQHRGVFEGPQSTELEMTNFRKQFWARTFIVAWQESRKTRYHLKASHYKDTIFKQNHNVEMRKQKYTLNLFIDRNLLVL